MKLLIREANKPATLKEIEDFYTTFQSLKNNEHQSNYYDVKTSENRNLSEDFF